MKRMVYVMLLSVILVAMGFAQTDLQPAAIVRLTKSEAIGVKQFRTEVERTEKLAGRILNPDERRQILEQMINERLVLQAAERDKIIITENEINQHLQQLRSVLAQQIGRQPTEPEFSTAIKNESGLDIPAFREQIRRQLIAQKYLMFKKDSLFKTIKVPTDVDIKGFYDLNKSKLVRPETVRFSMIYIPFGADAGSKGKAKALADRLARDIGSDPKKFDEATAKGQTPNSEYQAGDGGYLPRLPEAQQMYGQEFMNTAFSLKQGEISKLIEGPRGYQIIKITETYDQKNLEIDDIFQLGTRMTVRNYIGNGMLQQRQQEVFKKATDELIDELRKGNPFQVMERNLSW